MLGWLTKSDIPERITVCISLPNSEAWQADFRGAFLSLTKSENWEEHGALDSLEMSDEWRSVFFDFVNGECSMIPVGTILPYAGVFAPAGYFLCDGGEFYRGDFPDLWLVIGDTYGIGDGSTTANLPDLRGRIPVGRDSSDSNFNSLGESGGESEHALAVGEIPVHNHLQSAHNHIQDAHNHTQNAHGHTQDSHNHTQNSHQHAMDLVQSAPTGGSQRVVTIPGSANVNTQGSTATNIAATATNQNTTPTNIATTATNQVTYAVNLPEGNDEAHNNLQPYLTVNYMIKY